MDIKKTTDELLCEMIDLKRRQMSIEEILNQYFTPVEQTILAYEVSIGRKESRLRQLSEAEKIAYSNACQKYLEFGYQVDLCLEGSLPMRENLLVCDTPKCLLDIGLEPYPMHITQKHIRSCMLPKSAKKKHGHGLTKEDIKKLPENLENPRLIAESFTVQGSVVVITEGKDIDKLPILAAIAPAGSSVRCFKQERSNFITSVYGRSDYRKFVKRIKAADKLLYEKKESSELALLPLQSRQGHLAPASKGSDELALLPLQSRQDHLVPTSINIIFHKDSNVNPKTKNIREKTDVPKSGTPPKRKKVK